jgi:hypothetical protein
MLDARERAVLRVVDRLTRECLDTTDGALIAYGVQTAGHGYEPEVLWNLLRRLFENGYIKVKASLVMETGPRSLRRVSLTERGRHEAHLVDPFLRIHEEARHLLGSGAFASVYPRAFEAWGAAERLLWESQTPGYLTTVGHNVREAMQASATAAAHEPGAIESDVAKVESALASSSPCIGSASGTSAVRRWRLSAHCGKPLGPAEVHGTQKERVTHVVRRSAPRPPDDVLQGHPVPAGSRPRPTP